MMCGVPLYLLCHDGLTPLKQWPKINHSFFSVVLSGILSYLYKGDQQCCFLPWPSSSQIQSIPYVLQRSLRSHCLHEGFCMLWHVFSPPLAPRQDGCSCHSHCQSNLCTGIVALPPTPSYILQGCYLCATHIIGVQKIFAREWSPREICILLESSSLPLASPLQEDIMCPGKENAGKLGVFRGEPERWKMDYMKWI